MSFLTPERLPVSAVRMYYATDIEYAAVAAPGSLTSAAVWAISKTTFSSGKTVSVEWADGNELCDNIADNYASLTYV